MLLRTAIQNLGAVLIGQPAEVRGHIRLLHSLGGARPALLFGLVNSHGHHRIGGAVFAHGSRLAKGLLVVYTISGTKCSGTSGLRIQFLFLWS